MWKIPWSKQTPKSTRYCCEYGKIDPSTNEPVYRSVCFEAKTVREAELQAIAALELNEALVGDLEIIA